MNALQEARAEQRDHRHGDDKRSQQRQAERQGQGREQELADAVEERDREEIDHVDQRRGQHGQVDLRAALLAATAGEAPISRCR